MPPVVPLSRRRIAEAALELIDEQGFAALTVRAMGARLGVKSPSLYNHVSGRDEIIAAVAELLAEGIDLTTLERPDLAEAVRAFAVSYRDAFHGHPEVVAFLARSTVENVAALTMYERLLTRLIEAGWSRADAVRFTAALETVIIGATVLTFTAGLRDADPEVAPTLHAGMREVDDLDYVAFVDAVDALVAQRVTVGRSAS